MMVQLDNNQQYYDEDDWSNDEDVNFVPRVNIMLENQYNEKKIIKKKMFFNLNIIYIKIIKKL